MTDKVSIIVGVLRWLGVIESVPISKAVMCEQAKSICDRECENCAWNEEV